MSLFVFDIETVPDVRSGRRLLQLEDLQLSDSDVAQLMFKKAVEDTGQSFVRLPLHQIVAISVVFRNNDQLKIWSLGDEESSEQELITRFFEGIEKFTPQLISWNGGAFDLPVLHYRAMLNKVAAKQYWEQGESNQNFKWNNYISRYHQRHLDLMDLLALYQPRAYAKLDEIATILGLPGKMGMDGSKVWDEYQNGNIKQIRDYCETDVINTYLVYLHFQLMRGQLSNDSFEEEVSLMKTTLSQSDKPHFQAYLTKWEDS